MAFLKWLGADQEGMWTRFFPAVEHARALVSHKSRFAAALSCSSECPPSYTHH